MSRDLKPKDLSIDDIIRDGNKTLKKFTSKYLKSSDGERNKLSFTNIQFKQEIRGFINTVTVTYKLNKGDFAKYLQQALPTLEKLFSICGEIQLNNLYLLKPNHPDLQDKLVNFNLIKIALPRIKQLCDDIQNSLNNPQYNNATKKFVEYLDDYINLLKKY